MPVNILQKLSISNILGVLSLFLLFVLSYFNDKFFNLLLVFVENNISPDNHIEPGGIPLIANYFLSLKITLFFLFIFLTPLASLICRFFINRFNFILNFNQLINYFQYDLFLGRSLAKKLFNFTTSITLMAYVFFLIVGEPTLESLLEDLSVIAFVLASFFCFFALFKLRTLNTNDLRLKHIRTFLSCSAVALLFIAGEEISWGQRIFGWEAFGIFEDYNYQKEINLHNFFNPLLDFIYPAIGISFFVIVLLLQLIPSKNCPKFILLITPPPSFIILIFIMAGFSFKGHSEAFEELLAFFFVVYFYRILLIIRKQTHQSAVGRSVAIK